jgi:hypothetical protein
VGILKGWLVRAVAEAFSTGATTLTREILAATVLDTGQRIRIEMDARDGERKMAEDREKQQQQERDLWGASPLERPAAKDDANKSKPPSSRRRGRPPGSRAAQRDATGTDTPS